MSAPASTAVTSREPASTRAGSMLGALLAGQFMALLDVTIVNVAMARIGRDLHASGAGLQLVVSGYTVSYAVLLVAGARLGARYGHARAFRLGLAVFSLMSLLCGLAPGTGALIAFRVLQGAGSALMMPQVMSLIQRTFTGPARDRALSGYAAVIAGGTAAGQVLGGLLVSADVLGSGWRPVFLVNVPIGVVLLVLSRRVLPHDAGDPTRRVDLRGTVVLGTGVLLLVLPLVLGHELGWPAWCFVALAGSAVAFAGFARVERRVERAGGAPMLSYRVVRAPGLLLGASVLLLNLTTYSGYLFSIALHLQSGLGQSPAHAGLVFTPAAAGFALTGLTWQHLPGWAQRPMIPFGFVTAAALYFLTGRLLHAGTVGPGFEIVLAGTGLALGLAYGPLMGRALANVALNEAADASGVLVTVLQLGQVLGVAVIGSVYLSLDSGPGATVSGHAVGITLTVVAVGVLAAAGLAARLVMRRPTER